MPDADNTSNSPDEPSGSEVFSKEQFANYVQFAQNSFKVASGTRLQYFENEDGTLLALELMQPRRPCLVWQDGRVRFFEDDENLSRPCLAEDFNAYLLFEEYVGVDLHMQMGLDFLIEYRPYE